MQGTRGALVAHANPLTSQLRKVSTILETFKTDDIHPEYVLAHLMELRKLVKDCCARSPVGIFENLRTAQKLTPAASKQPIV